MLIILLEDNLPGPFPIGRVIFKSLVLALQENLLVQDFLTRLFSSPVKYLGKSPSPALNDSPAYT